ncbi:ABC transporter ATP-binding protein [Curtobacterium sp. MCBA15_012]|uniref:ABC transporter ATP-binding protein n=1 Tax=Curtobacterium sp. MCBA15_012 TaxID=1898738 RepID=UPI0008DE6BF4|nr:ABC transporter ATP-binding protein [Curtobacterium sp. MCBA15_012]WIA99017.1 ABC transporter ATP-binding protein [Curtobacterium sp. MCBA15_012]
MSPATPIVRVQDVSKRFVLHKEKSLKERVLSAGRNSAFREDFWALRNVDLEIDSGSTVGLIGPNGSGKSTLLKTIGGIIQPTSGSVVRRGRMAALLELGAGFHADLTGRENVYLNASILGLSRTQTDRYFDDIVDFSGIAEFIDTQVKFYSSGMYVRLAFAVAVHVDPDLLLVDEVLAVGDEAFQKKCLDKIASFQAEGRTIVLVTHTLNQITDLCSRALVLARGNVMFDGDPTDAVSVLRSGFQTTIDADAANAERPAQAAAPAFDIARVRSIVVDGEHDRSTDQVVVAPDRPLTIDVELDAKTQLDDWGIGVHVDNPFGQVVVGTHTDMLKVPTPSFQGSRTVRFTFSDVRLGGGEYRVTSALFGRGGQEIHRLTEGATFTVRPNSSSYGPIGAAAAIQF